MSDLFFLLSIPPVVEKPKVNKKIKEKSPRKYKGVDQPSGVKYRATISVKQNKMTIGMFDTAEEAARAYDDYVIKNKLDRATNKEMGLL